MAITEVASQRASSGTNAGADSDALAFPNNVTSGNLLAVGGATWVSSGVTSISVTDTRSTTYTVVLGTAFGFLTGIRTFLAYGIAPSSGACTVTVNPSGSSVDFSFGIDEFTGNADPVADVNGGDTQGSSTAPSDGITTGVDNALILGLMTFSGIVATMAPEGAQTQISEEESNVNNQCHNFSFKIVGAAGAQTMSGTLSVSDDWGEQTHSFKPSVAGGASVVPVLMRQYRQRQS